MSAAIANESAVDETGPVERLSALLPMLAAAMLGFALAEALARAKTSDAFILAPTLAHVAGYAMVLAVAAGLALAFEIGAPPLAAKGGHAARSLRALIRRRFRHGRTRAEIANVEVGLTVSFCAVLLAFALFFATTKPILVVIMAVAIVMNLCALAAISRLVGYDKLWSSLVGFVYGLVGGLLLA